MTIEANYDVSFVAALALKEKQIQQNYRPIIAVHKWFARRPGTLFRGLALAEFGDRPVAETFFNSNCFAGKSIADPFMGGGTPVIEANRLGCSVAGFDINPMAAWIVREELEHVNLDAYRQTARDLITAVDRDIGALYRTDCPRYGDAEVSVKYFLWVKVLACDACGRDVDLFPGYLLGDDTRHPLHVLVCPDCGELNEVQNPRVPGGCSACAAALRLQGPARRNRVTCNHCGCQNSYPRGGTEPPRHRLFAIEYYNPLRKAVHSGRFFKKPTLQDLQRYETASARWGQLQAQYVPEDKIPAGDETARLHRWGYSRYSELFNPRQLLGLELSCRVVAATADARIRRALATNLSDLLRYQNMLCRYDSMALKSLDIFSVHGFPVGLVQCESNLLGISNGIGAVGSGGWLNIVEKYAKAKKYCDAPFETRQNGARKEIVPIVGEWIGEQREGEPARDIRIECASAAEVSLPVHSLDAVFTDPPYFGNVQYAELMDFCYVWLRRLMGSSYPDFERPSTHSPKELTGNKTQGRDLEHFADGLSAVYRNMAAALKPGAPLAFTFHHNQLHAYHAVGVAILDAGLVCSAALPCPAEMSGSIHIQGSSSSIVDTVFVCRDSGSVKRRTLFETFAQLNSLIRGELNLLRQAGLKPSMGDIRCIVYGHLTRIGVWRLRLDWDRSAPVGQRLQRFANALSAFGNPHGLIGELSQDAPARQPRIAELETIYAGCREDAISF